LRAAPASRRPLQQCPLSWCLPLLLWRLLLPRQKLEQQPAGFR